MKTNFYKQESRQLIVYALLFCILLCIVYYKLFSATFISWDDGEVLLNNTEVHQFDLKAFFSKYYVGNYAPISMIAFSIDWLIFQGDSVGHHLMSLIFHITNGFLVYYLCFFILKDKHKALLCAIIFCFHPLQVETVAWVSAKNNLVYSFFFLLSLIAYSKFIFKSSKKYFYFSFFFFVLSVLSKPSAICLPLVLIILNYLLKTDFSFKKALLSAIPFFIISIILGIITIYTRTEDKFINASHAFDLHERIGYAGYAIFQYVYKFILPFNLSVIYPYPQNKIQSLIIGYIVILALFIICFKFYKSKQKLLIFSILFFIINLLLVLQFLPFGEVLTADRYMYLPIIGLAIMFVRFLPDKVIVSKIVIACLIFAFGIITFFRVSVWKNSETLYLDILKQYPHSFVALNSLGAQYMLNKNYELALQYLNKAINENTKNYKGYYNRGLLYAQTNKMKEAISDFDNAISLNKYHKAYIARANANYLMQNYKAAISDAKEVLKLDNQNYKALVVLANSYDDLNQLNEAMDYYNKAIYVNEKDPTIYLRRAILFGKLQQFDRCIFDLDKCISLNSNYGEAFYWRGVAKVNLNQNPCNDFQKGSVLGIDAAKQALQKYCK